MLLRPSTQDLINNYIDKDSNEEKQIEAYNENLLISVVYVDDLIFGSDVDIMSQMFVVEMQK